MVGNIWQPELDREITKGKSDAVRLSNTDFYCKVTAEHNNVQITMKQKRIQ